MARKRQRAAEQQEPDAPPVQEDAPEAGPSTRARAQQEAAPAGPTARREGMAEIARRRAAHFANFQDEDEEGDGNVHTGGDNARTLGPWSSAVELVNARQRAAAERNEKILQAARTSDEGQHGDHATWEPSRDPGLGPEGAARVRPLFNMCVDLLASHADAIASLWGVPDTIKVVLAAAMCARRKMSPEVAQLFADGAPSEVYLANCTQLEEETMLELLKDCCSARLERLDLGCCGRGFGDAAAKAVAAAGPLPALTTLRLHGAYRLTDAGAGALLRAAPGLRALALPDCPRLTGQALVALPHEAPELRELDLGGARGVDGQALGLAIPQLQKLERLALDGIAEVDDELLVVLGTAPALQALSIASCQAVTDAGVAALAAACPQLEELCLDECTRVGDGGLTALAAGCRRLHTLSLRRCTKAGDAALQRLVENGGLRRLCVSGCTHIGAGAMGALARACRDSLHHLDLSFCREVPEGALGRLADACPHLEELVVFGCSQVTRRFLQGHSNERLAAAGVQGVGTLGPKAEVGAA